MGSLLPDPSGVACVLPVYDWLSYVALVYFPTAALVVEIVSPGDETYEKVPFYAAHGVEEVLVVEPESDNVRALGVAGTKSAARAQCLASARPRWPQPSAGPRGRHQPQPETRLDRARLR